MEVQLLININRLSRLTLAFVFIYHGLVPKILWLSPVEVAFTHSHNLDAAVIPPIAGSLEILLGLCILLFRNTLLPVYTAMLLLIVLLLDVLFIMPGLLIEAFNPVTVNIASMVIAYFVCITHKPVKKYRLL